MKKLIIAASFADSMLVGVPSASVSPSMCYFEYDQAISSCRTSASCMFGAELIYIPA